MANLNHDHDRHAFVIVKGAPEQVLGMCANQRTADGGTERLQENYWIDQAEAIAARGQRVLAFAVRAVTPTHTGAGHCAPPRISGRAS